MRSVLRVCVPRRRDSIIMFEELDEPEAMTTARGIAMQHHNRSLCATQHHKSCTERRTNCRALRTLGSSIDPAQRRVGHQFYVAARQVSAR